MDYEKNKQTNKNYLFASKCFGIKKLVIVYLVAILGKLALAGSPDERLKH